MGDSDRLMNLGAFQAGGALERARIRDDLEAFLARSNNPAVREALREAIAWANKGAGLSAFSEAAMERKRQIDKEGWTLEHDDQHTDGSLATAAAFYASPQSGIEWPWNGVPKIHEHRRRLIIAMALIGAEVERLDRLEARND